MTSFYKKLASLAVLVYLLGLIMAGWIPSAFASPSSSSDVKTGLWLSGYQQGSAVASAQALTLTTDVNMTVSGMINRVKVTQRFKNDSDEWVHGNYLFPLPENSAVDSMTLQIGQRRIVGEIQEKQQAKANFERAKAQGKSASLVSQHRANVFETQVAHIAPGEVVSITIEYQELARFDSGHFELRLPTVVAPRYQNPVGPLNGSELRMSDIAKPSSRHPVSKPKLPINLTIDLSPGFELASLTSLYHRIDTKMGSDGRYHIGLAEQVWANKDFVLQWQPKLGALPQASVLKQTTANGDFGLMMLLPSDDKHASHERLDREMVFIIDVSGSMQGSSMVQAKQALNYGLTRLQPQDSFTIIAFSTGVKLFSDRALPATANNLWRARTFVNNLQAGGGTNMHLALDAAMHMSAQPNKLRQLMFLTDGSVSYEDKLLKKIEQGLGSSRLFTVGIGSAPNGYFMSKAAQLGRGSYSYIGDINEVNERMRELFDKLANPALRDIRLQWADGTPMDYWPNPLPDLYQGQPLLVSFKFHGKTPQLQIDGKRANKRWQTLITLDHSQQSNAGLDKLWAAQQIRSIELRDDFSATEKQSSIVKLALDYQLVSRYTSLIAVDKTPRNVAQALEQQIALNMPEGWDMGRMPQTGTASQLLMTLGSLLLLMSLLGLWSQRRRQGEQHAPVH
ncbi:marine proteobacterial sortase target protein [Paraferrimonas haliotis]|uniref:marine proteobacterial sortase target protein n=1 Tax=Paraferrimonas haliotis TaxID=2013866 RepID=UPI000BA91D32|nr:marine proteobacterial sortase target protein [Paraferrimonas haliotis]